MGLWSKPSNISKPTTETTTITLTTTPTTATKQSQQKSSKYINQRICPLEKETQQRKQKPKHEQPPPTLIQSQMDQQRSENFSTGNPTNGKKKSQQKSQNHNKTSTATICHCTSELEQKRREQQLQPQHRNFTHPNEVNGSLFRATLPLTRKRAVPPTSRNPFKRSCWICMPFLLTTLLLSAAVGATLTTKKVATTIRTIAALVTLAATIASVTVSVSGAAVPYSYDNSAIKYDKGPLGIAAKETENVHESRRMESGDELMYAYYKRTQHQSQRHLHQTPEELHLESNFEEIVPTLDVIPKQEFVPRPQKRSDKLTANTSKSSTPSPTASPSSSSSSSSPSSSPSSSSPSSSTAAPTIDKPASASASSPSSSSSSSSTPEDEKCEPKVLDEVPTEPFYDFSDVAEDAARQFSEFLGSKFPESPPPSKHNITEKLRQEITRRAYGIASYALNEDDNLLAFAIAAPSVHTVVLKFRSNVTVPQEQAQNKSFLGSYWRELIYAWNSTEEQEWGAPFRDCNLLKKRWLWPFRISYTENKFKIVAAAFIAADEDVCNDGLEEVFGRRHGCDRNTTFCLVTESKPMPTRDAYTCICRESFYLPNSALQGFRGDIVEMSEGYGNYSCIPCPNDCSICDQNGECPLLGESAEVVSIESLMKVSVGSVLGACILCCVVLSVIVFRQRKSKAIAIGMWTVLETILLGTILLYSSVTVHFFPASTLRCLIEPWLRELGFVIFYGAIILKLYRHLVDFRTRKAHRWVLRDVDLLKYLATMVFAVLCYLAGFTASSYDLLMTGQLESLRETTTNTCIPLKWEYVTQFSEIFIICFGLHLSFASRNANTQFRERQFLVATLMLEFIVSTTFYIVRFAYLQEMSPSTIFLALFLRSQLTSTISLGLIFVPKLWYQHKQVRSLAHDLSIRLPVDAFKGSHDVGQRLGGGYAGLCLGDPDIGELTISEMSPEDIRAELKRLYTQLEILKNKTLRQDNPHISKRRGGRKTGHRRFSLQALSAKHRSHKHHQDIEITEAEPSRTPEDSVCSVEGPTDVEISGISQSMLSHSLMSHSAVSSK